MKFRSQLEGKVANYLEKENIPYLYESSKYEYVLVSNYTPDFHLPNGVILEVKGFFAPKDRRKMLAMKKQHPDLDLRMVFQRNNTLTRTSKTTYGDWCDKHGYPWCIYPHIPPEWFQ